jgi:hypothetical protein
LTAALKTAADLYFITKSQDLDYFLNVSMHADEKHITMPSFKYFRVKSIPIKHYLILMANSSEARI